MSPKAWHKPEKNSLPAAWSRWSRHSASWEENSWQFTAIGRAVSRARCLYLPVLGYQGSSFRAFSWVEGMQRCESGGNRFLWQFRPRARRKEPCFQPMLHQKASKGVLKSWIQSDLLISIWQQLWGCYWRKWGLSDCPYPEVTRPNQRE